jgi:hypothetical protein
MPDLDSQTKVEPLAGGEAPDPLAGLYHMSTTAGAGTQDYVAINPVAIWTVFFGVASVLVVMSNVLFVVPCVAVVCGVLALIQIRSSNGTQAGKGLALTGLVLALAVGGGKLAYDVAGQLSVSADEQQIGQVIHDFGQEIANHKYDAAYNRFNDVFKKRVGPAEFQHSFEAVSDVPGLGKLQGIEWNHRSIELTPRPDTRFVDGYTMAYFNYSNSAEPRRVVMALEKSNGVWRPEAIESMFPVKKKGEGQ